MGRSSLLLNALFWRVAEDIDLLKNSVETVELWVDIQEAPGPHSFALNFQESTGLWTSSVYNLRLSESQDLGFKRTRVWEGSLKVKDSLTTFTEEGWVIGDHFQKFPFGSYGIQSRRGERRVERA